MKFVFQGDHHGQRYEQQGQPGFWLWQDGQNNQLGRWQWQWRQGKFKKCFF